eukprot:CAMPEP_0172420606 /NCGR_PEP_ID=MMETSP1064-20121228/6964_1 /TAXON_ID=202472 /ORGANISM="Aulacoseira subarctica , Strain CCAP 1002/5" /LENGTH=181 /DNA_ID=CAMNT_0013160641 /DNA_START=175 /DNA_END=720 /DNA_ORIENTATION=+
MAHSQPVTRTKLAPHKPANVAISDIMESEPVPTAAPTAAPAVTPTDLDLNCQTELDNVWSSATLNEIFKTVLDFMTLKCLAYDDDACYAVDYYHTDENYHNAEMLKMVKNFETVCVNQGGRFVRLIMDKIMPSGRTMYCHGLPYCVGKETCTDSDVVAYFGNVGYTVYQVVWDDNDDAFIY